MNSHTHDTVWPEPEWNADRGTFLGQCPLCATPPQVLLADTPEELLEAYVDHDTEWHPRLPEKDLRGRPLLKALLDPSTREGTWAKWAVRHYWWKYTGATFDYLGYDDKHDPNPDTITATDIVAVSMLDVHVPGGAARTLLDPTYGHQLHELLEHVPHTPMHEADRGDLVPGAPASQLWNLVLNSGTGVGPTIASKLVARKRPRLLPVYDTRVAHRLDFGRRTNDWLWWWDWWKEDPTRVAAVRELRASAGACYEGSDCLDASLLRILDVAVWRYDQHFRPMLRRR